MTPLPHQLPGPDNDLNEKLDQIVQRAMADQEAWVYAFGERWGPENMAEDQWTAGFLKFQSQSWHSDDQTGHTLDVPGPEEPINPDPVNPQPTDTLPEALVRIVAAMVNSKQSPENEWVFLLNTSDRVISLAGWQLAGKQKAKLPLSGVLDPGAILRIEIKHPRRPFQ